MQPIDGKLMDTHTTNKYANKKLRSAIAKWALKPE